MITKCVRASANDKRHLRSRWVCAVSLAIAGAIPGQAGAMALELAQDEQAGIGKVVKKLEAVTVTGFVMAGEVWQQPSHSATDMRVSTPSFEEVGV
ncbi:hypothetical protein [Dyella tabacisoli]|nr:hypothetical protein [Dyella tabacisoli]